MSRGMVMNTFNNPLNGMFAACANLFLCVSSFNREVQKFNLKLGYEKPIVLKQISP